MPIINAVPKAYVSQITRYMRENGAKFDGKTRFSTEGSIIRRFVDKDEKLVATLKTATRMSGDNKYIMTTLQTANGLKKVVEQTLGLIESVKDKYGKNLLIPKKVMSLVETSQKDRTVLQQLQTHVKLEKLSPNEFKLVSNKKHEFLHFKEQGVSASGYTSATYKKVPDAREPIFEKSFAVCELSKAPDINNNFFTRNEAELFALNKLDRFQMK